MHYGLSNALHNENAGWWVIIIQGWVGIGPSLSKPTAQFDILCSHGDSVIPTKWDFSDNLIVFIGLVGNKEENYRDLGKRKHWGKCLITIYFKSSTNNLIGWSSWSPVSDWFMFIHLLIFAGEQFISTTLHQLANNAWHRSMGSFHFVRRIIYHTNQELCFQCARQ